MLPRCHLFGSAAPQQHVVSERQEGNQAVGREKAEKGQPCSVETQRKAEKGGDRRRKDSLTAWKRRERRRKDSLTAWKRRGRLTWIRIWPYFPARIWSRLAFRESVCISGSAMLDWPPQYQTVEGRRF